VCDNDNIELGDSKAQQLYLHQINVPRSRGEWHMIPAMSGASKGTMKIIFDVVVGGALLATGIGGALGAFGAGATGLGVAGTSLSMSFTTMALMGTGLLLGGLNMLMSPTPKSNTANNTPTSFSFGGPSETDAEGGPVPLLLGGPIMVSGVRIGSSLTSEGANSNAYDLPAMGGGAYSGYYQLNGSSPGSIAASYVNID
jgi:predicted phage tail protein